VTSSTPSAPAGYPLPGLRFGAYPRIAVRWQTVTVCVLTVMAWVAFTWLSIAQHHAYHSHAYDLSWFDQTAWNTARGQWLANSFSHGTYFKEHFSPVLLVFGLVYRFWSSPDALLFIQASVAAIACIPLYIAVTNALHSRTAALLLATAYLLAPHLHGYLLFDFHPDIIAVFFIFTAFAFLQAGRPGSSLIALIPVFLVKEDAVLLGMAFAVFLWLRRYRRHARLLLGASAAHLVLAELVIVAIPHLLHWGTSGEQGRYLYLIQGGLNDPRYLWAHLTGPLQTEAMAYLFGSQALLPIAGAGELAVAPDLLANVLADHKPQLQLTLQYALYPFALTMLASVTNIRALVEWDRADRVWASLHVPAAARASLLAGLLLLAETVSWLAGSPIGLHVNPTRFRSTTHTAALERIVRGVPPKASVTAQSSILPHLSHRENIREFPFIDHAAYVVVDRKGFVAWDADVAGYGRVLASLPELGYCLLRQDDGVELWVIDELCVPK